MFLTKKKLFVERPFPHISTLVQTKYLEFWKVTDNLNTNNIEVYKLDDALNIKYAVWGKRFKNSKEAFKFINEQKRG
jgi:hypothetical protein